MLVLRRATGRSRGFWYLPGGDVEAGESAHDAVIRETAEECGIQLDAVELIALDDDFQGRPLMHALFVADTGEEDVKLSAEHDDYAWLTPGEYLARHCSSALDEAVPEYAAFFAQIRKNCVLVQRRLDGQ